jgi:acetolactate synthase I/II/III large subunit
MHIQELETIKRHGLRLLICVLNDRAYGAEIHKVCQDGIEESEAVFGRTDFGSIARGFGLRGTTIDDLDRLALCRTMTPKAARKSGTSRSPTRSVSPSMRRVKLRGHGVM